MNKKYIQQPNGKYLVFTDDVDSFNITIGHDLDLMEVIEILHDGNIDIVEKEKEYERLLRVNKIKKRKVTNELL